MQDKEESKLKKSQLSKLTPTELLLLQKHIQLGKDHLHKVLDQKEIKEIFALAEIDEEEKVELKSDKAELVGTGSVVFNTFMSAILGAWIGLNELLKLDLYRLGICLAIVVGGFIGFQNSRMRKKRADSVIEKRKLQDVELSIISEINRKRKKEVEEKRSELLSTLDRLGVDQKNLNPTFDVNEACLFWFEELRLKGRLEKEGEEMHRFLDRKAEHEKAKDEKTKRFNEVLKKLSRILPREPFTFISWLKANYKDLFFQVVPTLFGGASSIMVYLNGDSVFPEEPFKTFRVLTFLLRSDMLWLQLLVSLGITFYFAFTFIYLNRKAFLRDQQIEKQQSYIRTEEDRMTLLDDELLKLKEALSIMNIKSLSF